VHPTSPFVQKIEESFHRREPQSFPLENLDLASTKLRTHNLGVSQIVANKASPQTMDDVLNPIQQCACPPLSRSFHPLEDESPKEGEFSMQTQQSSLVTSLSHPLPAIGLQETETGANQAIPIGSMAGKIQYKAKDYTRKTLEAKQQRRRFNYERFMDSLEVNRAKKEAFLIRKKAYDAQRYLKIKGDPSLWPAKRRAGRDWLPKLSIPKAEREYRVS